jgi:hypothetical protein
MSENLNDLKIVNQLNEKLSVFIGEKKYFSLKDVGLIFKTGSNIIRDGIKYDKIKLKYVWLNNEVFIKREELVQYIIFNGYQQFVLENQYSFQISELSQMLDKDRRWFNNKIKKLEIIPLRSPTKRYYISLLESIKIVDMLFKSKNLAQEKYDLLNTVFRIKRYEIKDDLIEEVSGHEGKVFKQIEGTNALESVEKEQEAQEHFVSNHIPMYFPRPQDLDKKYVGHRGSNDIPETISSIIKGSNKKVLDSVSTRLRNFPIDSLTESEQHIFMNILKGLEDDLIKFKDRCKNN